MHRALLLIGGNEGDRLKNINDVKLLIINRIGAIVKSSSLYESEPWGFEHSQNFINQVIEIESNLFVHEILLESQSIEKAMGRKPKLKMNYEGRTMDIDILFYDDLILSTNNLTIPHPKLHERRFTLLPLQEGWKDLIHPVLKKNIGQLIKDCKDNGWVKKL